MKKRKLIDLSEQAKEILSIAAIKNGKDLKNFIQFILEGLAENTGLLDLIMKKLSKQ